jgi:outer membrane protein TolC
MRLRKWLPAVGSGLIWAAQAAQAGGPALLPSLSPPSPSGNTVLRLDPTGPASYPSTPPPARTDRTGQLPRAVLPAGLKAAPAPLRGAAPQKTVAPAPTAGAQRLTLEEAKQRTLSTSKVMALASLNIRSKEYDTAATRADYFPKVMGNVVYFHFNDDLGTVLATKDHPRLGIPPTTHDVSVFNQNSPLSTVYAAQPITALLKIRQGVRIARADEEIARSDVEKARRAISNGVEQLYLGLLAARRIRGGAQLAVAGAEKLAATGTLEARTALLEAKQGLKAVEDQIADVEAQLNDLLELPPCTKLELEEPPLPASPLRCADEAVSLALSSSPEVRAAQQDVVKADAAIRAAKVDYLPNVAVMGGYTNQTTMSYVQSNIGYVGVVGSYTFFEWGKKKKTVRKWETTLTMAQVKLHQTEDQVRQKAAKAFRELDQDRVTLANAREMVQLRQEAAKSAKTPAAAMEAGKAALEAEVALIKAELAYRVAYAELMTLIGKCA